LASTKEYQKASVTPKETSTLQKAVDTEGHKTLNEYVVVRLLGVGQYGKVKLLMNRETKQLYAVKILNKSILKRIHKGPGRNAYMAVLKEIAIWKKLYHPHVVQLFEVIDDPHRDKLYLITEYLEKGPIATVKPTGELQGGPRSESVVRKYTWDILDGLAYLHAHRIIHRDIKPENILLSATDSVKLADFGVSDMFEGDDDATRATDGTPAFMPPEAFEAAKFSGRRADIWSLGVTLFTLLTGRTPFCGNSYMDIYNAVLYSEPDYPDYLTPSAIDMLRGLLAKDPKARMTLEELRRHPWVLQASPGSVAPVAPAAPKRRHVVLTKEDIAGAVSQGKKTRGVDKVAAVIRIQNSWMRYLRHRSSDARPFGAEGRESTSVSSLESCASPRAGSLQKAGGSTETCLTDVEAMV
jgi:[calcium/calmodulin-dependent protein kinase] kinase